MKTQRKPKYVIGIDLGTTNSAVAYANISSAKRFGGRAVKTLQIPQLVAAGEVGLSDTLPSFLYIPPEAERGQRLSLPWSGQPGERHVVGRYAQSQGAKVSGRLVSSAKSWLSYGGVDRTAAILPWGTELSEKFSPVAASALYLRHLVKAWNEAFPRAPMEQQEVVLTVPASFDDVARMLTIQAANEVGLVDNLVLLEEPQAAFYEYFRSRSNALTEAQKTQQVMVVDVGGGTTDFTLITVDWHEGLNGIEPRVSRVAVGDHILLGGDNMDLAMAHVAEAGIAGQGRLDSARMSGLVQACREAKEALLTSSGEALERYRVTVPSRGSKLIGNAQSYEFSREQVEALVLDGFLPKTTLNESPHVQQRSGLSAWGLPYANDAAITRHVAAFLSRHRGQLASPVPDCVLLNGGVFKSKRLRERLLDTVNGWQGPDANPVEVWEPHSFDLAVARGAATFGLVRHGIGHRVGGGAARAYYVGVHTGKKSSARNAGVCILPRHIESGEMVNLKDRVFNLVVGRPVQFSLFSTTSDTDDQAGVLNDLSDEGFTELPPVQTVLEVDDDITELPVTLRAVLTEVGILELSARAVDRDTTFKLDFSLREPQPAEVVPQAAPDSGPAAPLLPGQRDQIEDIVRRTYGKPRKDVDPREIKWIRKSLETALDGGRDEWPAPTCRAVWDLLKVGARRRRRSEKHEATFFHLTGFCLRPGFGDHFDEWRASELWKLYESGVHFQKDPETWNAWWIMWRRVAGGLTPQAQHQILETLEPWLKPSRDMRNRKKPKYLGPEEATRLVGALEHISIDKKLEWGEWFLGQIGDADQAGRPAWCLARLGARQPFYGSTHLVIPIEDAERWVNRLLEFDWSLKTHIAFAAASLARLTGDRSRDLSQSLRERVANRLEKTQRAQSLAACVLEIVELSEQDEKQLRGDSLPQGLKLVST
ncbi:MAG: Hsp70 family protein [Bradymonadia bacterium]